MLNADVDTLLDIAVADLPVEDDADGGFSDVVYDASLTVVDFVGLWGREYGCGLVGWMIESDARSGVRFGDGI